MKTQIVLAAILLALLAPCVVAEHNCVINRSESNGIEIVNLNTTCEMEAFNESGLPQLLVSSQPTPAPITYPQEYYTLGTLNDVVIQEQYKINIGNWDKTGYSPNIAAFASLIASRELRRQTILMEKQNELLAEQMRWQRNARLACAKWADMHYGQGCQEYAWVGGA